MLNFTIKMRAIVAYDSVKESANVWFVAFTMMRIHHGSTWCLTWQLPDVPHIDLLNILNYFIVTLINLFSSWLYKGRVGFLHQETKWESWEVLLVHVCLTFIVATWCIVSYIDIYLNRCILWPILTEEPSRITHFTFSTFAIWLAKNTFILYFHTRTNTYIKSVLKELCV